MNAAQPCAMCATDEQRAEQRRQHLERGSVCKVVFCVLCRAPLGAALQTTPEPAWYRMLERVP